MSDAFFSASTAVEERWTADGIMLVWKKDKLVLLKNGSLKSITAANEFCGISV